MHRTTILLDEQIEKRLRRRASQEDRSLTDLIQSFICEGLNRSNRSSEKRAGVVLPSFAMGEATVDPADRSRLWDIMDER